MLTKNSKFDYNGVPHILLLQDVESGSAWIIEAQGDKSLPKQLPWASLMDFCPIEVDVAESRRNITVAMKSHADQAWQIIEPLVKQGVQILHPKSRGPLIEAVARERNVSKVTIYSNLRRYWQRGQNFYALLPDFDNCGKYRTDGASHTTCGRGRKPNGDREIYQITEVDRAQMAQALNQIYLKDKRINLVATFNKFLQKHHTYTDGNGVRFLLQEGMRPSLRQFNYFASKTISLERAIRCRDGDKQFEQNHRASLGSAIADAKGVGDYYEIDATIADIHLVAVFDVNKIVGKPTLYLIVDKRSRLIVGFYVGLEHASWSGAMEAIRTISADKRALCDYYGVTYDPEDWPAHEIFPTAFVADRGPEMIGQTSNHICEGLSLSVVNLPSQRPDWKPMVECGIKLIQTTIKDVAPGFDPVENATRRQSKKYDKDACLTLKDFGKLILEAVIAHNRKASHSYALSPQQITAGVMPTPIAVWNHDIYSRSGLLTKYSEPHVRYALLPKDDATVTPDGILFKGLYYSCNEAMEKGWYVRAHKGRFKVTAYYDSRLVDHIYVVDVLTGTNRYLATLTQRSQDYNGFSFAEAEAIQKLRAAMNSEIEQNRMQQKANFDFNTSTVVAAAQKRLKSQARRPSRSSRRADTKEARSMELRLERQASAVLVSGKTSTQSVDASDELGKKLLPLTRTALSTECAVSTEGTLQTVSMKEYSASKALADLKRKMIDGL